MEARKIKNREDAESCLAAASASGCTPTQWAHANGVNARSLQRRRVLLGGVARRDPVRLVELVAAPSAPATTYRVRCGAFEVALSGDFDDLVLGRLLRVVATSC